MQRSTLSILRCPACASDNFTFRENAIDCTSCGASYLRDEQRFNFLTDEFQKECVAIEVGDTSGNSYDGPTLNLINKYHKGLILDCGSGKRDYCYRNVVNFEIAPYENTDVLGVGEHLPFRDNSFDAVLSLAVLIAAMMCKHWRFHHWFSQ